MEIISNEEEKEEIKAEVVEEKEEEKVEEINNINLSNETKKAEENEEKGSTVFEESKKYYENKQEKRKKILKWITIGIIILAFLLFFSLIFALLNINNEKIIEGVSIDKIDLHGLTIEEAKSLLHQKTDDKINNEITVKIDNEEQKIVLSNIELEYNIENTVELAYKIGRKSNIFVNNFDIVYAKLFGYNLDLSRNYNSEMLENVIKDIKSKIPNVVVEVDYSIEDESLIITPGKPGVTINEEELKQKIEEIMSLCNVSDIEIKTFNTEPKDIDVEEIYKDVYTEAKDAYYTKNPFQIYPEVIGIDFNVEEAKEILKEQKEEYIIPLTITKPQITVNSIGTEAFPDRLATFTTRYDASNVPRTTNLKLAVSKINGTVVMPGETFSYNKTVGKRTAEAGYKEAAGYQGGKVVQMTGGGICQISSTLYDAAVYANLEIVERHNHAFTTSYVGAGKDATVVYGSLDLKFKNTRNYPISIKASAQNGIAQIDIYGIKEDNEYEIDIVTSIIGYIPYSIIYENDPTLPEGQEKTTQNGSQGCKSVTYKICKLNGAEISRTVLSRDTYDAMNKYISRGTKKTSTVVSEPTTPIEPTNPEEPTNPTNPTEPTEPVDPAEPIEPENPQEPVTPTDPVEPENPNSDE